MLLEESTIVSASGRPKQAVRLRCDVCDREFWRDVNVRKWREAARHRCSPACFGIDSRKDGIAGQQRRDTVRARYGVDYCVNKPGVASRAGRLAHSPGSESRRWAKIRQAWATGSLHLRRGLTLRRSKQEVTFLATLEEVLGECVPQRYVNGWFIDGYFPRHGLHVQFDGIYWHGRPLVQARDAEQDRWFADNGLRLLRVTDREWREDPEGVISRVRELVSPLIIAYHPTLDLVE